MSISKEIYRKQKLFYAFKIVMPIIILIAFIVIFFEDFLNDLDLILFLGFVFVYFYFVSFSNFTFVLDSSGALRFEYFKKFQKNRNFNCLVLLNIKNIEQLSSDFGFKKIDEDIKEFYKNLEKYIEKKYYKTPIVRLWAGYFVIFFKKYEPKIIHDLKLFKFNQFEIDAIGSNKCELHELFDKFYKIKPQKQRNLKIQKIQKNQNVEKFLDKKGFKDLEFYSLLSKNITKDELKNISFMKDYVFVNISLSLLFDNMFFEFAKSLSKNIIFEFEYNFHTYSNKEEKRYVKRVNAILQKYKNAGFLIAQSNFFYPYFDIDIAIFDIDFTRYNDEKTTIIFDDLIFLCKKLNILTMSRFVGKNDGKTDLIQGFYYYKPQEYKQFKKEYLCLCQNKTI